MIISTKNCVEECIFYSLAYFTCCSHFSIRCQCFGVCLIAVRFIACSDLVMSQFTELEELEAFVGKNTWEKKNMFIPLKKIRAVFP